MADSDVGKLFVGGISRDTNDTTLRNYFIKYGDVSSSIIAKDRITGAPRGFGFLTFSDPLSVDKALLDHHVIGGRTVEVKKAIPRHEQTYFQKQQPQQQQQHSAIQPQVGKVSGRISNDSFGSSNGEQQLKAKKIFVGGLSTNLTEEEFRTYFEKFGKITDVVVMRDPENRPRGFGFITFDSEEAVEIILQKTQHELAGKSVEVKIAVPRDGSKNAYNRNNNNYNYNHSYSNNNNPRFPGRRFSPISVPRYAQVPVSTPTYPGYYYGGVYNGVYPGYEVVGYGMPMVAPRSPWNPGYGGVMGVRPLAYGTGYYPTGLNGGANMMGMVNPYTNIMDPIANGKTEAGKGAVNVKKSGMRVEAQSKVTSAEC